MRLAGRPGAESHPSLGGSDILTSGAGYGSRQANVYKQSPQYRQAVVDTFLHQSDPVKDTIVQNALHSPSAEGKMVLDAVKGMAASKGLKPNLQAGTGKEIQAGPTIFQAAAKLPSLLIPDLTSGQSGSGTGPGMAAINAPTSQIGGATQSLGKELQRSAKDAITLPAQPFTVAGTIAQDVINKGVGAGLHDVVGQYEDWLKHPKDLLRDAAAHPLDTALALSGPVHGITRLADAGIRAVTPGDSLVRPGIQLGGQMTHERPAYSPYPIIRAGQKTLDRSTYKRTPEGLLVPRDANVKAKLTKLAVSRLVGMNERLRRAARDEIVKMRARSVASGTTTVGRGAAKVAKGAKTALKYTSPQTAKIAGADVLSRIADFTVRRPETLKADLLQHAEDVSKNRPNLIGGSKKLLNEHDRYVKTILKAANKNYGPKQLARLFQASEEYAKQHGLTQSEAKALGQFAGHTDESLLRRSLGHYAIQHMGAKWLPEMGIARAGTKAEVRAFIDSQRVRQRELEQVAEKYPQATGARTELNEIKARITEAWDRQVVPMETSRMQAHAARETGGRTPAFTSDMPKRGSAYYIKSEVLPHPETRRNTYFAYTHGLTDPSDVGMMEQHVRMQGKVSARLAVRRLIDQFSSLRPDGLPYSSYDKAKNAAPEGKVPIALSPPFHPQESLSKAMEGTNPTNIEEEAQRHGLDLNSHLVDQGQGRWGLIDEDALKRLQEHEGQIQQNTAIRAWRGASNLFRNIALGTSPKHIPGIVSEDLIRSIANAEGIQSWIVGHQFLKKGDQAAQDFGRPELAKELRARTTSGGTLGGMAEMAMTHTTSDHFRGTSLYKLLRGWEAVVKTPGVRQVHTAWQAWIHFALQGTKHVLGEQFLKMSLGKQILREFGAEHGQFAKTLRIQGQLYDMAAKGVQDPALMRRYQAGIGQIRGIWNDLTPHAQTALMAAPFGLWWVNSVKWLLRSPIDRPLQTAAVAAATMGTEKERMKLGEDQFAPNALPLFMQGGVPLGGGRVLAQNYYSPFGVANDPMETAGSLIEPTVAPLLNALQGNNWLGRGLTSPGNPKGYKAATPGQRAEYFLNSLAGLFVPLYSKAESIRNGGASAYDSSNPFSPQTKTPGKFGAGLAAAVKPFREYGNKPKSSGSSSGSSSSGSSSGGYLMGGGSSGSSSGSGGGGYLMGGGGSSGGSSSSSGYLMP